MRKFSLCLLCLGLLTYVQAQDRGPIVIAPAGTSIKGNAITLDWTLGELAVRSLSINEGMLTEGFHQPVLRVEEWPEKTVKEPDYQFQLTVAPNPVRSILSIRILSELKGRAVIRLWDLQGRRLQSTTADLSADDLDLDMSTYPAAVYTLSIQTEKGELLRSFKVAKID